MSQSTKYKIVTHFELFQNILHEDGYWIPIDPANRDYQEYLAWVAEGNEAEEWTNGN